MPCFGIVPLNVTLALKKIMVCFDLNIKFQTKNNKIKLIIDVFWNMLGNLNAI